jgi:hypothetical protein
MRIKGSLWSWIAVGVLLLVVAVLGGAFVQRTLHPPVKATIERSHGGKQFTVIQCDVVNASGHTGLARVAMNYLRERGFDVVDFATAPDVAGRTVVLDRVGDLQAALNVARALGIADTLVRSNIDSMLFLHATVVLGKDATSLDCLSNEINQ